MDKCSICKGTGKVFSADSSGAWMDMCPECMGSGNALRKAEGAR